MARRITEDGSCFRHVISYLDKDGYTKQVFFGPYADPAVAKAQGTSWLNGYGWGNNNINVLERYTEVSDTWRRI